jgi:hypothetical protein
VPDLFRRVGDRLTNKMPCKYQRQEELYSCQTPGMAREFRDDCSDNDDGDNSTDNDFVDSYWCV